METATIPGMLIGMIMRTRVPIADAPSIPAASSSPLGSESKYPASIQMATGSENVRYVMMSPRYEPYNWMPIACWILMKMMNSGSMKRMPGNICVESTTRLNTLLPANRYLLRAYPARIAIATEINVALPEMTTLFMK